MEINNSFNCLYVNFLPFGHQTGQHTGQNIGI